MGAGLGHAERRMKDDYARYVFSIGTRPGCGLTDKGYEVLEAAIEKVMADALDGIYEKLRAELPDDVEDAVQMLWRQEV